MLEFCSLYSGSSGNCLFVNSNNTKILVDCGTSCKKIVDGLQSINYSIEDIDAILVTHEHSDHVQGLGAVSNKFDIPVYANAETWNAMGKQKEKILPHNIKYFKNEEDFVLNDLNIHPFSTPHDAANPCGFNIHNGKKQLSIATDLGHVTDKLIKDLEKSSFILLESNYEPEILKVSRYPYLLKQRIAGPYGHISNEDSGSVIAKLMSKRDLKQVMLGHLSKENNFPELAYKTVAEQLMNNNQDLNTISISVASRSTPGKIIKI
jgi:phosphoribosyl 1,2-cyclic phosphodiesterase